MPEYGSDKSHIRACFTQWLCEKYWTTLIIGYIIG